MHDNNGMYNTSIYGEAGYDELRSQKTDAPVKKNRVVAFIVALSLVFTGLGSGLIISNSTKRGSSIDTNNTNNSTLLLSGDRGATAVVTESKVDTSKQMTASEIYKANVNSCVGITTELSTNYFGYTTTAAASGSGFIVSKDGYVVTNNHVIEGASSITVTTYDGETYSAKIVGTDESNDIAVLKIDADDLIPVVFGSSSSLEVGEDVIAIGNPLGELTFSLTTGVVSALNRTITIDDMVLNLIQTDCAINSGNSGGPLFNSYGELIGITNAKYSSSMSSEASIDNLGFAIPIDDVKSIITSIIEKGYSSKPYIGVTVETVSEDATEFGVPEGAVIRSVTKDGPADKAGLKEGDIITEFNGKSITSSTELVAAVKACSFKDEVNVKYYRKGEIGELTLAIGESQTYKVDNGSGDTEKKNKTRVFGNEDDLEIDDEDKRFSDGFEQDFEIFKDFGEMF